MPSSSHDRHSAIDDAALFRRGREGDRAALGRLITRIESGSAELHTLVPLIYKSPPQARIVGITGTPGAGKSTLIGAMLVPLLATGRRLAVVSIDPTSPLTQGAVLGDRLRMTGAQDRRHLFIRSLAARGALGGLSASTGLIVDLLDSVGFEMIIVETVGVGQSEVGIADLAQSTLLLLAPNLGDEVQSLKAGILEIADLFVVNKCDLPGAAQLVNWLDTMPPAPGRTRQTEVFPCSATEGTGVDSILAAIDRHFIESHANRKKFSRLAALLRNQAIQEAKERLSRHDSIPDEDVQRVATGMLALDIAAKEILRRIFWSEK